MADQVPSDKLTPAEEAAIRWRQVEKRMTEHPCACENCLWTRRLLMGETVTSA